MRAHTKHFHWPTDAGSKMDSIIAMQRWLYGGMAESMRSTTTLDGLPALVALAFLFGVVHALMPGHGKSVLVSYHLGRPGRWGEGIVTGSLLALTHVGSAVMLVLAGIMVISRSVAAGGRAPSFEVASGVLIALIGAWLLLRSTRMQEHEPAWGGKALAVATGLVPCPLTTFILTFALAKGILAVGLIAVAAMLAGVVTTLVTLAVTAVIARDRLLPLLARTERLRWTIGKAMEVTSAGAVIALGLLMLSGRFGKA
jgi:nickel/cobalt transporter (NicO) family protein